ncbi:MAG: CHAT domain-containing protein [Phormidesmis sp.]
MSKQERALRWFVLMLFGLLMALIDPSTSFFSIGSPSMAEVVVQPSLTAEQPLDKQPLETQSFSEVSTEASIELLQVPLQSPPQDLSQNLSQDLSQDLSLAEAEGRALYLEGRFTEAVVQWQIVAEAYAVQQHELSQAGALSNLSLSYQQLGQWQDAQTAIMESLRLAVAPETVLGIAPEETLETTLERTDIVRWRVLARSLMTQGSLYLALGKTELALTSWQQAADVYEQAADEVGANRAQINQAQALRELGFYRLALEKLSLVVQAMETQPPSALRAIALRRLGEALRLSGQLSASQTALRESLAIARQSGALSEISATLLSLGHTAQSLDNFSEAKDLYAEAIAAIANPQRALQQVPIWLSQLDLAIATDDAATITRLWPAIQSQFKQIPTSRIALYRQIHWANSLIKFRQQQMVMPAADTSGSSLSGSSLDTSSLPSLERLAQQLHHTIEQARTLDDRRSESYAMGTLGHLYEQNQQWAIAQQLTDRALSLSRIENATDLSYQWQWQLGRLWKNVDNPDYSVAQALEAYQQAIETLGLLRGELSATDGSAQFSFEENVEPIYRQLVGLLLQVAPESPAYSTNLEHAQGVIESLRLAELDNYFKEACVDVKSVDISRADPRAAVVYTIVLEDQLSVLLHLPNQPIQQFSTVVSASEVSALTSQLRQDLVVRSRREYLDSAAQLYDWLVAPAREAIDQSGAETLVFVLDGALQNVPMATLYDGERFLIEDYSIALTPGLTLLNPRTWGRSNLRALIAGMTESRQGLSPLPYVAREVEKIVAEIPRHTVLLDQQFTQNALSEALKSTLHPIVHIATHGQFGSTAEETHLLAWDRLINVREIAQMLQANLGSRADIELLVLSACETASGDQRAALGLAGVAVKAGARSTLGSLWAINDEATAEFVGYFYEQLTQPGVSRAAALRLAQLRLLNDPQYQHPIYWAPYTLLGSWL